MLKIFLLILILAIVCIPTEFCAQTNNNETMDYKIEITNLYFGRTNHITTLENNTIKSETNLVREKPNVVSRQLTINENNKIIDFLKDFPIADLEENYVYNGVKDGTQMWFYFKIGEVEKKIFVANAYQKDLGNLVALIVPLLKEDYIGYDEEYVYWKVK